MKVFLSDMTLHDVNRLVIQNSHTLTQLQGGKTLVVPATANESLLAFKAEAHGFPKNAIFQKLFIRIE